MKMLQCYAQTPWLAMVDEVVARSGSVSRTELIERLLREEAARRRVRVVPRPAGSKFDRWRHQAGPPPVQAWPPLAPAG